MSNRTSQGIRMLEAGSEAAIIMSFIFRTKVDFLEEGWKEGGKEGRKR